MKKAIALFLALVMCLSMVACGKKDELTADMLKITAAKIKVTQECCASMSALISNGWSDGYWFEYYFDKESLEAHLEDYSTHQYDDQIATHTLRETAKASFDLAKTDLEKSGNGKFYDKTKAYYIEVLTFYNLVSDFPTGYNKETYSDAVAESLQACSSAYDALVFYLD